MEDYADEEEDISNLLVWIEEIGDKFGALNKFFRNESITSDVRALPPPTIGWNNDLTDIIFDENIEIEL